MKSFESVGSQAISVQTKAKSSLIIRTRCEHKLTYESRQQLQRRYPEKQGAEAVQPGMILATRTINCPCSV